MTKAAGQPRQMDPITQENLSRRVTFSAINYAEEQAHKFNKREMDECIADTPKPKMTGEEKMKEALKYLRLVAGGDGVLNEDIARMEIESSLGAMRQSPFRYHGESPTTAPHLG